MNRGSRPVIALQSVSKIYGAGDTAVHAVDGVTSSWSAATTSR